MSMVALLIPVGVIAGLAACAGWLLGYAAIRLAPRDDELVERIESLLPQTQCGQCRQPGCRAFAAALASGAAEIDQCPPGGEDTARALAALLGRSAQPGSGSVPPQTRTVARIDEDRCIGCALCIPACPVDAIAGAPRFMHTILSADCTGCELCLPPCPVDCIEMRPVAAEFQPLRRAHREVETAVS
jgi:electron transport complex protein RnfB